MLTDEDSVIRQILLTGRWPNGALRKVADSYSDAVADAALASRGDRVDAAIMAEFANQDGQRATLTPITLATVGLDWDEVRAIARAHWGDHVTLAGDKAASEPATLEHITLDSRLDWVQNPPSSIEEC